MFRDLSVDLRMGSRLEHRPKACFDGKEVGPMRVVVGFGGRRGASIGTGLNSLVRYNSQRSIPSGDNRSITRASCPALVHAKPSALGWRPAGLSVESVAPYGSHIPFRVSTLFALVRSDGLLHVCSPSSRLRLKELSRPHCVHVSVGHHSHGGLF